MNVSALLALVLSLLPLALSAHVVELPKLLQNNVPVANLIAGEDEELLFRLVIPEGAENLHFSTSGGRGDCDIFVSFAAQPQDGKYDASSEGVTNDEDVAIQNPQAGVWFVRLVPAQPFQGVRLLASYQRSPDSAAVPRVLPGPGTYSGLAKVQLKTALKGGRVRYTTDGQDPDATSPLFTRALKFTADTELRVQTFLGEVPFGPVLVAPFTIIPAGSVTPLESGAVLRHRAGMIGSETLYRIHVPAGQQRLQVLTAGRHGGRRRFPPAWRSTDPHRLPSARIGVRNRTELTVVPCGRTTGSSCCAGAEPYSGLTLQASYRDGQPDLVVWPETLQPHVSRETFEQDDAKSRK